MPVIKIPGSLWQYVEPKSYLDSYSNLVRTTHGSIRTSNYRRVWTRTPGFKHKVLAGDPLPCNPFQLTIESYSFNTVIAKIGKYPKTLSSNGTWIYGTQYNVASLRNYYNTANPSIREISDNALVVKTINDMKGANWNLPVFVAEGKETISMILGVAKTLSLSYRDLKKGKLSSAYKRLKLLEPSKKAKRKFNFQRASDPSKAAANAWLQMQYGWIPLLCDVKSAAEHLAERSLQRRNQNLSVKSTIFKQYEDNTYLSSSIGTILVHRDVSVSKRMYVEFTPTKLDSFGSLGLTNPLEVVWELVPLSFVADWFLPIGDYLSTLDAPLRYKFITGLKSNKETCKGSVFLIQDSTFEVVEGGTDKWTYTNISAVTMTSLPSWGFSELPFSPNLGVKRFISGMSLLRQTFR